jgi:hypothetical protein
VAVFGRQLGRRHGVAGVEPGFLGLAQRLLEEVARGVKAQDRQPPLAPPVPERARCSNSGLRRSTA